MDYSPSRRLIVKRYFVIILTGLLLSAAGAHAQMKIGYVDTQKIMGSLKETQDVQARMQEEQEKLTKQFQYLQDSLATAQEDYAKNVKDNPLLKEGTKQSIQKGIEELAYLVQTSSQRFQEELYKKQQELMQPIVERVKKAVENVRKASSMELVLDSSFGVILASDESLDLTQKTLDELVRMGESKDTGKKEKGGTQKQ